MLNAETFQKLQHRFRVYHQSFQPEDRDVRENLQIKREHTMRVCREARLLGEKLGLPPHDVFIAEISALFHDIGRFEQYTRYGTYLDRESVNHAELGVEILRREQLLDLVGAETQELILQVIAYHNRAFLPEDESERCLLFSKLLRDADKLDIWRVVLDNQRHAHNGRKNAAVSFGLPDTEQISEAVCDDLRAKRIVDIRHLRTLNDFKLLQIGWVYDINFVPSLEAVCERRYLEHIRATLPQTSGLQSIFTQIDEHIRTRLKQYRN